MVFIKDKAKNVQSLKELELTEAKGSIPGGTTIDSVIKNPLNF